MAQSRRLIDLRFTIHDLRFTRFTIYEIMTPERYRQIGKLFHAVLEVDADERAAFLERECAADAELRREVESLLQSHKQASGFIAAPALAVAAELLAQGDDDALIGRTIARYRVLSLIGVGGMGRVYLAEDTGLGRRVALKLLPEHFTHDRNQLQRFHREARAVSALNHPNILTVHEVGQVEGTEFIATEFVEGETLRERLKRAPFGVREALEVATQVGGALVAAHAAGIVHRDVKPENIMLRRDGYVKVLDFGIAKLVENLSGLSEESETLKRETRMTSPGTVIGTAQYMSPEQARGLPVDGRADVWSLGVVIYEMVAGRCPFEGATYSDTIVSILEREPAPLNRQAPEAPAELERIVTKALTKVREERYQTVKDMALDLRQLSRRLEVQAEIQRGATPGRDWEATPSQAVTVSEQEESTSSTDISRAATTSSLEYAVTEIKRHKTGVAVGGAILIAGLAGVTFGLYKFFGRARPATTNAILKVSPLTSLPGVERSVSFSPDGKQIAFAWTGKGNDNFDVYVKIIGVGEPLRLTNNPAKDMCPVWSPDARYIAFLRGTGDDKGFYLVPALGGAERRLTNAYGWSLNGVMNQAITWSPDGRTLAVADKAVEDEPWAIFLVSVETGERRKFTNPPASGTGDSSLAFSPDGRMLAFVRSHDLVGDIYVAPISGGAPFRLTSDEATINGLAWTPDAAEIVFSSERGGNGSTLWRIPAAAPANSPAPILGVGESVFDLALSGQGNRLAFAQMSVDLNIYSVGLTGPSAGRKAAGLPVNTISSTRMEEAPQFSPDGRRVLFISNRTGDFNLWVCDADGKNPAQLTDIGGLDVSWPSWSPDGRFVAFDAFAGGNEDIYIVPADGGVAHRMTTNPSGETTPTWSPDGSWVYFSSNRTGRDEVWKIPAAGGAQMQLTSGGGFNPVVAPDGLTVYYLRGGHEKGLWTASTMGGAETRVVEGNLEVGNWAVVGRGIYFLDWKSGPYSLNFFDFATHRTTQITTLGGKSKAFLMRGLTVAPDERTVLYAQRDLIEFDLMLVENFR